MEKNSLIIIICIFIFCLCNF